ncbi:uncharacterized protein A4U43_C08F3110 [Asparagus officinalis]|nr:uncharacterized protein A4U43_C08F3110 [Asparagus officinalis]
MKRGGARGLSARATEEEETTSSTLFSPCSSFRIRCDRHVDDDDGVRGFPVWLKFLPGISFRTDNEPFKNAMQGFTQKIVQMMKNESLFESQIENEYRPESRAFGPAGCSYVNWAAKMAVEMDTGVLWVMCKEDAPDPVINTCNDFYCDDFAPNKPYKPSMWTEAWSSWDNECMVTSWNKVAVDFDSKFKDHDTNNVLMVVTEVTEKVVKKISE